MPDRYYIRVLEWRLRGADAMNGGGLILGEAADAILDLLKENEKLRARIKRKRKNQERSEIGK